MLPLNPEKLNIKLEGALGWRDRGSAKHARLAFYFYFFFNRLQAKGDERTLPQSQPGRGREMES